jgi:uncharacterized membrane protein
MTLAEPAARRVHYGGVVLIALGAACGLGGVALWVALGGAGDPHGWSEGGPLAALVLSAAGLALLAAGLFMFARGTAADHSVPATFLGPGDEAKIIEAIGVFEKRTSGELRVHVANGTHADIMSQARLAFEELGLTATRERNGVLFYVAVADHRFAVLGDKGINEKVPTGFWDEVAAKVSARFAKHEFGIGLVEGIHLAGEALASHFPPRPDDVNELPNTISRES